MAECDTKILELRRASIGLKREAVLLAYAVHHGYKLEFSSEGVISNLGDFSDDTLFCEVVAQMTDDGNGERLKSRFSSWADPRLQGLYEKMTEIPKEEFDMYYCPFIRSYGGALVAEQADHMLASQLKELEVGSVLDWGISSLSLLEVLDNHVGYTAIVRKGHKYNELLVRVAAEINNRENVEVILVDPENPQASIPEKDFDAVVYRLRYQAPGDHEEAGNFLHTFYVENKCRYAFLTMDLLRPQYDALAGWHLFKVLDARDEFSPSRHVLAFDMKDSHNSVEFSDGSIASYEQIDGNGGWLNTALYSKRTVPEGCREVAISDIAEFSSVRIPLASHPGRHPTYHLSKSFAEIASPLFRPQVENSRGRIWQGRHLHLGKSSRNLGSGMYAAISNTQGFYRCECDATIDPDPEKVCIEYLALILLNDSSFSCLFNLVPIKILRSYRIVIEENLDKQREIVDREIEKDRDVVNSSGVYNVALVNGGGIFQPNDIRKLEEWNLVVSINMLSVYGKSGLKELIPLALKEGTKVDAILVDAGTDAVGTRLKGLQGALKFGREKEIPVFVYSALALEDVKADLEEEDLEYCEDNHLFTAEGEFALKRFITAVRDELDKNGTLGAQLRTQYRREFRAAEKVEGIFGGSASKDLEKFLSKPNEVLNEVRKSTEGYLNKIAGKVSSGSGLEKVDPGFLPRLFKDSMAEDRMSNGFYVLTGRIMDKTLGTALVYMYQICDGASHGEGEEEKNKINVDSYIKESGTTNIAMSAIRIYMEFLVWLASTEGEFDVACEFRDSSEVLFLNCLGTVHRVSRKEFYIETDVYPRVHLGKTNFKDGQRVIVNRIFPEKSPDFVYKYEWFTNDVREADPITE